MFILQTSSWAVAFLSHRTAMQSIIFMKLNGFINKYDIITFILFQTIISRPTYDGVKLNKLLGMFKFVIKTGSKTHK